MEGGEQYQENNDGDVHQMFHEFFDLMKFKVTRILLVSSLYDAFTLEEDGLLTNQISGQYSEFELSTPPQIIRVSSGEEALEELKWRSYDLVITMARLIDMDPFEFSTRAKSIQSDTPLILLLTERGDVATFHRPGESQDIDKVFYWSGDSNLFLAIIKYVEDQINAKNDTKAGLVSVILVIEDSPRYYSMFLPIILREVMEQTSSLIAAGLNEHEKLFRKKARPKIILAENHEEAMQKYQKFKGNIIGVITDVSYDREGVRDIEAGFHFIEEIDSSIPVLVQSSHEEHREGAEALGIPFLNKGSDTLLYDLRNFFRDYLGFGDFVFRLPGGEEVGRASDMREFIKIVRNVSVDSLRLHGSANQFSNWLRARGEFPLAIKLRAKEVGDFKDAEDMRQFLIDAFWESRKMRQQGVITDFSRQTFEFEGSYTRLGKGSLGGKGRGLAFLGALLNRSNVQFQISGVKGTIPDTLVIGTDEFDTFMDNNALHDLVKGGYSDEEIKTRFLEADLAPEILDALRTFLEHVRWPLAVRSSSMLEDSQNQPFAGIYATYILPNNCEDEALRLEQLCQAVKVVYASTFSRAAQSYIQSTVHFAEEEKMAVVIQKLVGRAFGDRFYPLFSGVAQSYNFYPVNPLKREEGIVSLALGLGNTVVEGEQVLSFSPKHPNVIPGFTTPEEAMKNSQQTFYALNLDQSCFDLTVGENVTLVKLNIEAAEKDGNMDDLASTYDANDNRLRDGISAAGPRGITFAGVLKYNMIPLVSIIEELMRIGQNGMGRPVEIEFAVSKDQTGRPEVHVLQIRPLVTMREHREVHISEADKDTAILFTDRALGNGILKDVTDIIFVPPQLFDALKTVEIAREIGDINKTLDRPYILIGPGRWGTRDRWLGIPVEWDQISHARAIVEAALEDFRIDPSHGTHFFHNITSLGIMYLTVPYGKKSAFINWEMLNSIEPVSEKRYVRHLRIPPVNVKVDGRNGYGVISS
jgi:CheY-like chemotaxis protein